jgi:tRNA (mo5U34)-methyltransferase
VAGKETLADRAAELSWYHTIELPGGVRTEGFYDTVTAARRLPLPPSLAGKRCLDVGTSDGFWAFEMERRGAAEVVAIDVNDPASYDWPDPAPADAGVPANREPGANPAFELAHEALGSSVERVNLNVYDVSPEELGRFDFVFMGALMLHLRDPVAALRAVRTVVGGEFLSSDAISLWSTLTHPGFAAAALDGRDKPRWWTPNLTGYRRMLEAAGFEVLSSGGPFFTPFGKGLGPATRPRELRPDRRLRHGLAVLRFELVMRRLGAPSAWALCRPNPAVSTPGAA